MLITLLLVACAATNPRPPCGSDFGSLSVPSAVTVPAWANHAATWLDIQGTGTVCAVECDREDMGLTLGDYPADMWPVTEWPAHPEEMVFAYHTGLDAGEVAECWVIGSDGDHAVTVAVVE